MTNMLTHNLGYIQQYQNHVRMNALNGKENCQCKLYCGESAIYADKIGKVSN